MYLTTACATFNINDSGETIAVCDLLALGHSPGYPLHALLGRLFCLLPLGQPMLRVTFCSMMTGAASVVLLYAISKMALKNIYGTGENPPAVGVPPTINPWILEVPSLFGALSFAFSYQHWFQSGGAKGGIYTLNTFLTLCVVWILFKMREKGWFIKSVFLIPFFYGLGLANHWPHQIASLPAYLWLFLAGQKKVPMTEILRSVPRPFELIQKLRSVFSGIGTANLLRAATFAMLPLSVYLYLPIRAIQNPVLNWWNPQTAAHFWETITRESYNGIGARRGWATLAQNLTRFWLQAHHQYGSYFTYFIFAFSIWGLLRALRNKEWTNALGILILGGGIFVSVILFNNPVTGLEWTLDNFFSIVFLMFAFGAALGMAETFRWIFKKIQKPSAFITTGIFGFLLAIAPLVMNHGKDDQGQYVCAYDEGINMLKTVPPSSVILCGGDVDLLPLWYLQFVEGLRADVVPVSLPIIIYDWYKDSLFSHWPFLKIPTLTVEPPEDIVRMLVGMHGPEVPFYYTNCSTPQWLGKDNASIPDGMLWRMAKTKGLDFPVTASRLNELWGTYRIRQLDPGPKGYWDEFSDYIRVYVYDYAQEFMGLYAYQNQMPEIALWSFQNSLKDSPPANRAGIYQLEGEIYLQLGNESDAVKSYQESLNYNP